MFIKTLSGDDTSQSFEIGQLVTIKHTGEKGMVLQHKGNGYYDVRVLEQNNKPTNVRWIVYHRQLNPYTD